VHPAHGSTVDRPHNPKGYAILSVHARSNGPDPVHAGAAANTPGKKTARQHAEATHLVVPRQSTRLPIRPRADALHSRNTHARDRGVQGVDRASSVAGTRRGRRGRSGEIVSAPKCTRRREFEWGLLLTVRRRGRRARRRRGCDGGEAWQRRRVGRRSGAVGARLLQAPGMKSCGSTGSVSPWRTKEARKKNDRVYPSPVATKTRQRRGTEAAAMVKGGCSSACAGNVKAKGKAGARARAQILTKREGGEGRRKDPAAADACN
jgi:hypothetical protein